MDDWALARSRNRSSASRIPQTEREQSEFQTHAHQIKAELKRRGRKESEQQLALQIRCKDILASCLFVVLFAECLPRVLAFLYCREFSRSGMQPGLCIIGVPGFQFPHVLRLTENNSSVIEFI
ncbi:hypothetical protein ASPVEDRAFT_450846 [Aspergillus versicolor CBS 583.65]|uniref:Uncharacterized protein n=1 Tax=Aspergillus versicolor CBS 583.65 TaxID=1036611 RepID=A0A1L9P9V7_ASPVE|nr:uncharacterized protein ASPVEDRAFT_450846 [Aspergillus versicolor CBS 583.65]OJI98252.1 hypothetical protein ASPVEDRAFT_450846 [Aspergillus versicolor CBS 583.65]